MKIIVVGMINTDLVASGIKKFPRPGELVFGRELSIGPGGKSRNIADMIAQLGLTKNVAMIGKTVRDPYGLWKPPIDALAEAGVITDFIVMEDYSQSKKLPSIALIPVDQEGNNQIYLLPGIGEDFEPNDIDFASELFAKARKDKGMLVLTLECPIKTAVYAIKKAKEYGLMVAFDPGGIDEGTDIKELITSGIDLIKPNEHEAKLLTGIDVIDFSSAKLAAEKFHDYGIADVVITAGAKGAYLFTSKQQKHLKASDIKLDGSMDETGCGDQTMASLCAYTQLGKTIEEAAELAVISGTLQFHRSGIKPITNAEIEKFKDVQ